MRTPVVFLVFNRPGLTARVFARIRDAAPEKLFVVADGPRAGRPEDAEKCRQVREVIETGVDWPCEVTRFYSKVNQGSACRVSSGITEVFKHVEEAIILEDDCMPDPSFFPFCEELLDRYRNEPRVAQIAGCSFQDQAAVPDAPSYYFSRYPHCWGWATWRRAWNHYDHEMHAWRGGYFKRGWLRRACDHASERRWWAASFDATIAGAVDAWDFRWTVTVFREQWFGVLPYRNLVSNIGFGPDATHTRVDDPVMAIPALKMSFPLVHPKAMQRDARADEYSSRRRFRRQGLCQRILNRLRRSFGL